MANHKQAKKRIRQTAVVTERNRAQRSAMRTSIKRLEKAIEAGEKETVGVQFKETMSMMHKSVTKGVVKKETASRKLSRLSARIKAMTA